MKDVMILAALSVAGRLTGAKKQLPEAPNIIRPKKARKRKSS